MFEPYFCKVIPPMAQTWIAELLYQKMDKKVCLGQAQQSPWL